MKADIVTLSSKYQVVIPKAARKKLGLSKPNGQRFKVEKVTDDEIVFRKDKTLNDFLGAYGQAFPKNATEKLRQMRDEEWED
jgi:AbrB family looped-hinge helix DNA binding protein